MVYDRSSMHVGLGIWRVPWMQAYLSTDPRYLCTDEDVMSKWGPDGLFFLGGGRQTKWDEEGVHLTSSWCIWTDIVNWNNVLYSIKMLSVLHTIQPCPRTSALMHCLQIQSASNTNTDVCGFSWLFPLSKVVRILVMVQGHHTRAPRQRQAERLEMSLSCPFPLSKLRHGRWPSYPSTGSSGTMPLVTGSCWTDAGCRYGDWQPNWDSAVAEVLQLNSDDVERLWQWVTWTGQWQHCCKLLVIAIGFVAHSQYCQGVTYKEIM